MNEKKQRTIVQAMLNKLPMDSSHVLFVHSAFKTFSQEGYSPDTVLQTFMEHMRGGTLLLPTMSWRYVKPDHPFFDERRTPSNTGILTELFRQQYASHRSLHPTHSVAGIGNQTQALLSGHHHCVTPCGETSPFAKLVEVDAYILMLGVGIDCCTLIHYAEEMLAPEYYVKPASQTEEYQCQDRLGNIATVKLRRHRFLPRNYWQFQDKLAERGELFVFQCGNSICIGFWAKKLFQMVADVLKCAPDAIIAKPGQRYRMM